MPTTGAQASRGYRRARYTHTRRTSATSQTAGNGTGTSKTPSKTIHSRERLGFSQVFKDVPRPRQWIKNILVVAAPLATLGGNVHYDYKDVAYKVAIVCFPRDRGGFLKPLLASDGFP